MKDNFESHREIIETMCNLRCKDELDFIYNFFIEYFDLIFIIINDLIQILDDKLINQNENIELYVQVNKIPEKQSINLKFFIKFKFLEQRKSIFNVFYNNIFNNLTEYILKTNNCNNKINNKFQNNFEIFKDTLKIIFKEKNINSIPTIIETKDNKQITLLDILTQNNNVKQHINGHFNFDVLELSLIIPDVIFSNNMLTLDYMVYNSLIKHILYKLNIKSELKIIVIDSNNNNRNFLNIDTIQNISLLNDGIISIFGRKFILSQYKLDANEIEKEIIKREELKDNLHDRENIKNIKSNISILNEITNAFPIYYLETSNIELDHQSKKQLYYKKLEYLSIEYILGIIETLKNKNEKFNIFSIFFDIERFRNFNKELFKNKKNYNDIILNFNSNNNCKFCMNLLKEKKIFDSIINFKIHFFRNNSNHNIYKFVKKSDIFFFDLRLNI